MQDFYQIFCRALFKQGCPTC